MALFSRRSLASSLLGAAIGALLVGLILPFVWNDASTDRVDTGIADADTRQAGTGAGDSASTGTPATAESVASQGPTGGGGDSNASRAGDVGSSADNDGGVASAGTDPSARTASDVGVTGDEARIGAILHDIGAAGRFGVSSPAADIENQRAAYQAYFDEVNAAGGVNGRRLTPVYRTYDVTSEDSARAVCNQLTEGDRVFAILAMELVGPPVLCVTEQHGTLLISEDGHPDQYYRRSNGLAFTSDPSRARTFRNQVAELHDQRVLRDRRIGILTGEFSDEYLAVDEALIPALRSYGYEVAHYAKLSGDIGTAQGQVPLAVRQMQAAGVDVVFLAINLVAATNFAQTADAQGYRPLYLTNDANASTTEIYLTGMPDSFEAIGITTFRTGEARIGRPEPAYDRGCREQFERSSGLSADRNDPDSPYGIAMNACNLVRILAAGMRGAGPTLTRAGTSESLRSLEPFDMAFTPAGSFGTTKFDAPDFIRTARSVMSCRCWEPVDEYRRSQF